MNLRIGFLLRAAVFALCAQAAQAAPGDIDTTFGASGFAFASFTDFGLDYSMAFAIARDASGRLIVAGQARPNAATFSNTAIAVARFNADGSLDTTFGQGGRVRVTAESFSVGAAVKIQGDGKIVVAGYTAADTSSGGVRSLVLLRFNANGSADTTFGNNGRVNVGIGGGGSISDMAIQGDGRILVVGQIYHATGGGNFYLARFLASGSPDTSFGAGQFPNLTASVNIDFGGRDGASAVAIQNDGKIVVAGTTEGPGDNAWAVARLTAGGLRDSTFGSSGRVTTNFQADDHGAQGGDRAHAVALQGDGKIVVAGQAEMDTGLARMDFALARYNANGALDATFSGDGKVTTDFVAGARASDVAFAVLVQPDGRIVAGGLTGSTGGGSLFGLARYSSDGSLDAAFSGDGKVATDSRARSARAMTTQTILLNGRIVGAGDGSFAGNTTRMTLVRFDAFAQRLTPISPP